MTSFLIRNNIEQSLFNNSTVSHKPHTYFRYVDDTLAAFSSQQHAESFLDTLNNLHPNLTFTMESEANNQISFLDVLVSRDNNHFTTSIFRKSTFTGLGLQFSSFCPLQFKINSISTFS